MICIYHSRDMDGFTSGAIVKRKYPDATLIGFDYGEKLPMDRIPFGEPIIMIDVSLPMEEMFMLAKHANWDFTWIDHHISAINEYDKFIEYKEAFLMAVLKIGVAACEIGWGYLFPDENIPAAITLLGKYDTWRNHDKGEWNEMILPFQYGMRLICNSPESFPVDILHNRDAVLKVIDDGVMIVKYQSSQNQLLCRRASFEVEFDSYRAVCLNMGGASSQSFESVYNEDKHDVMMPFFFDGSKWVFSLYTTKPNIDCSAIAKNRGGGGHKGAAGFQVNKVSEVFSAQ